MSIALQGIVKVYGSGPTAVPALNGLELEVADAEVCIVRGPNGSGKTTLIGILTGELEATAGVVRLSGNDGKRPRIGVVRQFDNLEAHLTVREHFELLADPSGLTAVPLALHDRRLGRLTRGERQVVAIALAMSTQPDVLLADEPTGALPSDEAHELYDVIEREVRRRLVTVLLVTHDARAERIADRVVSLRDGRISDTWRPGEASQQVVDASGWLRLPDDVRAGLRRQVRASSTPSGAALEGRDSTPTTALPQRPPRCVSDGIALSLDHITCTQDGRDVLTALSHDFPSGSITTLNGRPGAGKTTLLRALAGITPISAGTVRWANVSPMPHAAYFSVELPFAMHCSLDELIPKANAVADLELDDLRGRALRTLSGGQRQRAIVALALAHASPIVLLDEPTTALDERGTDMVLDAIARSAKTFIIATHDPRLAEIATHTLRLP